MTVGSKSLLFGVHQFIWHPVTVWRAWRLVHGRDPRWHEAVAIVLHDVGYWGCIDMDGPSGQPHPIRGAEITRRVVTFLATLAVLVRHPLRCALDGHFGYTASNYIQNIGEDAYGLALGHSRRFATLAGAATSDLFRPDKLSLLYEPRWFYLLRARLSGEIHEYVRRSETPHLSHSDWFDVYYRYVVAKFT